MDDALVATLRRAHEWQAIKHGGCQFSIIENRAPFEAADRIQQLTRELAEARSKALEEAATLAESCSLVAKYSGIAGKNEKTGEQLARVLKAFAADIRNLIDNKGGGV